MAMERLEINEYAISKMVIFNSGLLGKKQVYIQQLSVTHFLEENQN
jgi:hypothetical protein